MACRRIRETTIRAVEYHVTVSEGRYLRALLADLAKIVPVDEARLILISLEGEVLNLHFETSEVLSETDLPTKQEAE